MSEYTNDQLRAMMPASVQVREMVREMAEEDGDDFDDAVWAEQRARQEQEHNLLLRQEWEDLPL